MILREVMDGVAKTSVVEPVFDESYDLVVVGLGTAGAVSLITAGREGLNVLGVEQLYGMGGTATLGAIAGYYFGAQGGLYTEMDEKERQIREGNLFHKSSRRETALLVRDREARACGAQIKYNCIVTGVYMDENKMLGLRLFQNGSEIHVKTQKVIDATGEATVCFIAGCEYDFGQKFDSQAQPATSSSLLIDKTGRITSTNKDAGFVRQHEPRNVSRVVIESNNFPMYLKKDYSEDIGYTEETSLSDVLARDKKAPGNIPGYEEALSGEVKKPEDFGTVYYHKAESYESRTASAVYL